MRLRLNLRGARGHAICTGAVPLRQAAAGRAAENVDADQPAFSRYFPVRSDRTCVTGALKKDRDGLQRGFDPALFVSPHINRIGLIGLSRIWVKLFFNEADVAAAFHAGESNIEKVVRMYAKTHVFVQIMR